MSIKIWYCDSMKQWRWTVTDSSRTIIRQESGQQSDLGDAMKEVANSVEQLIRV